MSPNARAETLHRGSYLLCSSEERGPEAAWPKGKELMLMVLNEPIPPQKSRLFAHVWKRAAYRICIDGGTNQLYSLGEATGTLGELVPDAIVGDLDSVQDKPREFFSQQGAVVRRYEDQDSTDFMKGLLHLDTVMEERGRSKDDCIVCVFGGLGGRLDHILHTLKVLFNNHKERDIVVVSDENLTFVVPAGRNRILVNRRVDGPTCGILPLAGETRLTTSGLRWNLDNHPSSFEGLMSTSNIIDEDVVHIETTVPVAWTAQFTLPVEDTQ